MTEEEKGKHYVRVREGLSLRHLENRKFAKRMETAPLAIMAMSLLYLLSKVF